MKIKQLFFSIKPAFLMTRFRNRFRASLIQRRWESNLLVRMSGNSSRIVIGSNDNFRRGLQLRAVNNGVIEIGSNCFINTNVTITSLQKISIGNDVKIANNVVIVDHDHNYSDDLKGYNTKEVTIGDKVWIGANCAILKGSHIGKHAVVAAGSIVTGDVPENAVVAGVPAKVVKKV